MLVIQLGYLSPSFISLICYIHTFLGQDKHKKSNYVQISIESYNHLSGLENQVKIYEEQAKVYEEQAKAYENQVKTMEDEINELNEKVSTANSEITTKEELVKQHAKVAEEAVSGMPFW